MRRILWKGCMAVFQITLPLFLLIGTAIVVVQAAGILMGNGGLVLRISALKPYAAQAASICAFAGYFAGYLRPGERGKG